MTKVTFQYSSHRGTVLICTPPAPFWNRCTLLIRLRFLIILSSPKETNRLCLRETIALVAILSAFQALLLFGPGQSVLMCPYFRKRKHLCLTNLSLTRHSIHPSLMILSMSSFFTAFFSVSHTAIYCSWLFGPKICTLGSLESVGPLANAASISCFVAVQSRSMICRYTHADITLVSASSFSSRAASNVCLPVDYLPHFCSKFCFITQSERGSISVVYFLLFMLV